MNPLVSIIIPTYNRAHLISETLDSVLSQTYANWECIVVDDGSTDNSLNIIQQYCERDDRFKFFARPSNRNKGASCCRNIGLENTKGKYIQFLDSDDLLSFNKIEGQVNSLKEKSVKSVSTCRWGRFNSNDNLYLNFKYKYNSYKNFNFGIDLLISFGVYGEFFPSSVYLIPKEILKFSGKWDESLTNNDDGEFFTRVLLNSTGIVFTDLSSVFYREEKGVKIQKLSAFNDEKKCSSAIKSWKLIEIYIFENTGLKSTLYVENAKNYIFNSIKKNYKKLIKKNRSFFKNQIKSNSLFNRLKRKLF